MYCHHTSNITVLRLTSDIRALAATAQNSASLAEASNIGRDVCGRERTLRHARTSERYRCARPPIPAT